jgi:hypothetical protein
MAAQDPRLAQRSQTTRVGAFRKYRGRHKVDPPQLRALARDPRAGAPPPRLAICNRSRFVRGPTRVCRRDEGES